jgi:undecaprenyl-diphosphatase
LHKNVKLLALDSNILFWINGHWSEWLDAAMWFVSQAKTWVWLYVLLVALIAYKYREWKIVLLILMGFGIAVGLSDWLCSGVIKPMVCRLRPTHEPAIGPLHLVHGYVGGRYGFCSSHAANTMSVALLFSLLYRRKIATFVMMSWVALNCYSRMYLGVHYPSDIIVGLLVGALWAVFVWLALQRWLRAAGEASLQDGS